LWPFSLADLVLKKTQLHVSVLCDGVKGLRAGREDTLACEINPTVHCLLVENAA
jgi:hypothetical protein